MAGWASRRNDPGDAVRGKKGGKIKRLEGNQEGKPVTAGPSLEEDRERERGPLTGAPGRVFKGQRIKNVGGEVRKERIGGKH